MKLLRVKASNFKNCQDDTVIDLVAKSKKTTEDKEYELQEIAEGLYVYSIGAFIGKNASGKTTALELLDCCYDILGKFSLENKHYSYEGIKLEIIFFHEGYIYKYATELKADPTLANRATFSNQHIYKKKYYKTKLSSLYTEDFVEQKNLGELPEDTASTFFVLKKKQVSAIFFGSDGMGADTYQMAFRLLKTYHIPDEMLSAIIRIFDSSIQGITIVFVFAMRKSCYRIKNFFIFCRVERPRALSFTLWSWHLSGRASICLSMRQKHIFIRHLSKIC